MADCNKETFTRIEAILEQNGEISEATKTRLLLLAMVELYECVSGISDKLTKINEVEKKLNELEHVQEEHDRRLDKLEKSSILLILHRNWKLGVTVLLVIVFLLALLVHNYPQLSQLLGIVP